MKYFLLCLAIFNFSSQFAEACSCGEYLVDPQSTIDQVVRNQFGNFDHGVLEGRTIKWIKAYPTVAERLNIGGFKNTSCEFKGPNNESLFMCARHNKGDFEVTLPAHGNCKMIVRAKASLRSASAEVIENNCR